MSTDILVVDDEPDICELVTDIFSNEGYTVRTATTSDEALNIVRARAPNLVILDIWLQGSTMDGLSVLKYLKALDPLLPVIVISGHGTIETSISAIKHGACDFLEKPLKANRLLHLVKRSIESTALKKENETLRQQSPGVADWIGTTSAAQTLRAVVRKVAPTNSRVMITGPTGAGKELCARLIHLGSRRRDGPFVVFNAMNTSPERIESEMFGEENANAMPVRIGVFEKAHGGSLFLDEISNMPPGTQKKILRTLTEQRFQRCGGRTDVSVDVRIMSSATHDLDEDIAAGRLRADLYHRLNVVSIKVPSLAERRADIPALIEYFTNRIANGSGLMPRVFSKEAIAVLQAMDWPGNVKQLRNVVERVLILSRYNENACVSASELLFDHVLTGQDNGISTSNDFVGLPLRDARAQFEREYLMLQIMRFDGNISRTAKFIGMERSALHRKLKTLGVNTQTSHPDH